MKIKVEIRCGNRYVGEYLDLSEIRDGFDDATHALHPGLEYYIRPIEFKNSQDELERFNGNHFIYGYLEGLFQSHSGPEGFLDLNLEWTVTVSEPE
jgi:hypothetical protein